MLSLIGMIDDERLSRAARIRDISRNNSASGAAIDVRVRRIAVLEWCIAKRLPDARATSRAVLLDAAVVRAPAHRTDRKIRRHDEIAQTDHGPRARETVMDQWGRWVAWLDKYVKNPGRDTKVIMQ